MIAERCSNAGSILDHLILFHPDIELLNFGNPKILQMLRRQASPEAVELLAPIQQ
jgi:hypothetical protein